MQIHILDEYQVYLLRSKYIKISILYKPRNKKIQWLYKMNLQWNEMILFDSCHEQATVQCNYSYLIYSFISAKIKLSRVPLNDINRLLINYSSNQKQTVTVL